MLNKTTHAPHMNICYKKVKRALNVGHIPTVQVYESKLCAAIHKFHMHF